MSGMEIQVCDACGHYMSRHRLLPDQEWSDPEALYRCGHCRCSIVQTAPCTPLRLARLNGLFQSQPDEAGCWYMRRVAGEKRVYDRRLAGKGRA